ncbi:CurL C-terminal domain-containing protein, partial [Clavibacter michiganensis]
DTDANTASSRPRHVLTLSAKTEAALRETSSRLSHYLGVHSDLDPADVSYTLNTGRSQFMYRLAVTGANTAQLAEQLAIAAKGESGPGIATGRTQAGARPRIAFLFTGQGAQYSGMGRQLYDTQPAFHAALD